MRTPEHPELLSRRHDIDTVRIIAFMLLIVYHIGMLYVANWDYHVKSSYTSEWLESLMLLVNRWRLPLLFLISGVAMRYILAKVPVLRFLGKRALRLLIPLAFGVLVVVPPQLYYEMTQNGDLAMSYWQFYQAFFDLDHPLFADYQAGILPHMDVNHLWYIRELWTFSVYLLLLSPLLNSRYVQQLLDWMGAQPGWLGLGLLPMLPLVVMAFLMQESDSETYRKALGFAFMSYGYLLGWQQGLWNRIQASRYWCLGLALASYLVIVLLYNIYWLHPERPAPAWLDAFSIVLVMLNRWCWIIAILGLAACYLNRSSKLLDYLNSAVYPWYILHQSIIIIAAFELGRWQLGPVLEPLLVIVITTGGCVLLYEFIIRRTALTRLLFGVKAFRVKPAPSAGT